MANLDDDTQMSSSSDEESESNNDSKKDGSLNMAGFLFGKHLFLAPRYAWFQPIHEQVELGMVQGS